MDSEFLVNEGIEDGYRLLLQLVQDGFEVTAAYWAPISEGGSWYLFIASPQVTETQSGDAFRALYRSFQKVQDVSIPLPDLVLKPTAKVPLNRIVAIQDRSDARVGTWCSGARLGDPGMEKAFLYQPIMRPQAPQFLGKRTLRKDVRQIVRPEVLLEPLSQAERTMRDQLQSTGMSREAADSWVLRRREDGYPLIPAGTLVDTEATAWLGRGPAEDTNPVVRVKTSDGAQGLTLFSDTEPVEPSIPAPAG